MTHRMELDAKESELDLMRDDTPETSALDQGIYGYSDLLRQFRALLELSKSLERERNLLRTVSE